MSPTCRIYQIVNTPDQDQLSRAYLIPRTVYSACSCGVTRPQKSLSSGISGGEAFQPYSLNQTALPASPFLTITSRSSSTRRKLSFSREGGSSGGASLPYALADIASKLVLAPAS